MKITAKFREFENESGTMKGYADLYVDGSVGIKDVRLMNGSHGMFLGMPTVKVGDEYKEVVTGVSKEFAAQALEAVLAAKESEEKRASIGEAGNLFYDAHATALQASDKSTKALASLTIRGEKDAKKSAFTINNIRVVQGEKGLFASMPSEKTENPDFPYNSLCVITKENVGFVNNLIVAKAKDALGIERKSNLEDRVGEAKEKAAKDSKKAGKEKTQKKEKESGRAE